MASPSLQSNSSLTTASQSATTTHAFSGTPAATAAGDLLLAVLRFGGLPGTVTFTGWTQLASDASDASDDTTQVYWRVATGSDGVALTTANSVKAAGLMQRITLADTAIAPQISAVAVGTGAAPNPPALTPAFAATRDMLLLGIGGWDGETQTLSSASGYSVQTSVGSGTGGAAATNCFVTMAFRSALAGTVTTEDPAAWTLTATATTGWTVWTIAVAGRSPHVNPLLADFELGTEDATVRVSDPGSPGVSNYWDAVAPAAASTITYDSEYAMGTRALKMVHGGGASNSYVRWTHPIAALGATHYGRAYLFLTGYLPGPPSSIIFGYNGGNTGVAIDSTGKVGMFAQGIGLVSAQQVPLFQWVRLEWRVKQATVAGGRGEVSMRAYWTDPNGTTPDHDSGVFGNAVVFDTAADFGVYTGNYVTPTSAFPPIWVDEILVGATDWVGPSTVKAPRLLGRVSTSDRVRTLTRGNQVYAAEVAADDPVAWYRMQEASGLLRDSSAYGNHASASTGTATYAQSSPIQTESADKSVNFSGDDWFFVPGHVSLDVGDEFTIEGWVKPNATSSTEYWTLAAKAAGSGYQLRIAAAVGGRVELLRLGLEVVTHTGSFGVTDTNWHHIVATRANGVGKIYVDGVDRTAGNSTNAITNNTAELRIGLGSSGEYMKGLMDEVAIYRVALPAARVLEHYQAAFPSLNLGPVSEVDSALTLSRVAPIFRSLTATVAPQAAQALPWTKTIRKTLTAATHPSTALALSKTKTIVKALTPGSSTNAAQPLTFTKTIRKTLGAAASANAAPALSVTQEQPIVKTLTAAVSSNAAQAVSFSQAQPQQKTLVAAASANVAQARTPVKTILKSLAVAASAQVASALVYVKAIVRSLVAVGSSQASQVLAKFKPTALVAAASSQAALSMSKYKPKLLVAAMAPNSAVARPFTKTIVKTLSAGVAPSVAQLLSVTHVMYRVLAAAVSPNAAQVRTPVKTILKTLAAASSSQPGRALTFVKTIMKSLAAAVSQNVAGTLTKIGARLLSTAVSANVSRVLVVAHLRTVPATSSAQTAQALGKYKPMSLVASVAPSAAQTLTKVGARLLSVAVEVGSSRPLSKWKQLSVGTTTQPSSARPQVPVKTITKLLAAGSTANLAGPLSVTHVMYRSLTASATTNTAGLAKALRQRTLTRAAEVDSSQLLAHGSVTAIARATELDSGQIVYWTSGRQFALVAPATEADAARVLRPAKPLWLVTTLELDYALKLGLGSDAEPPLLEQTTAGVSSRTRSTPASGQTAAAPRGRLTSSVDGTRTHAQPRSRTATDQEHA